MYEQVGKQHPPGCGTSSKPPLYAVGSCNLERNSGAEREDGISDGRITSVREFRTRSPHLRPQLGESWSALGTAPHITAASVVRLQGPEDLPHEDTESYDEPTTVALQKPMNKSISRNIFWM